ncbi:hypothetical protein FACS1894111_10410 [Clostridia bacterium]|nr:hypothetical protein FACS1894111_10410 [Clostridia bacterium]
MEHSQVMAKTKIQITFDFEGELNSAVEKLEQIICSSHWASRINIFTDKSHKLFVKFVKIGVIVIDACEYGFSEQSPDSENARLLKSLLGKRDTNQAIRDMAMLFTDEPFVCAEHYRNAIYLSNLKAYARADGIKPEDIVTMLASDECDRILLFPYHFLGRKPVYYELTLGIEKNKFANLIEQGEEENLRELCEAMRQANERSTMSYKSKL